MTAARHLSPYLGARMMPVTMLDRSLFIRELTPQDLKLEVEQFSQGEAVRPPAIWPSSWERPMAAR